MSKVYRCKECSRTLARREELRPHLYWHKISDADVERYFSQEDADDGDGHAPAQAQQEKEKSKGVMGWLRRN